jgi:hypothetical protein
MSRSLGEESRVGASLGSVPIIECLPKFRESIAGPRNRHRWCGRRLTAAYRLAHRRPRATVFDAWNRVGGRKFSTKRQRRMRNLMNPAARLWIRGTRRCFSSRLTRGFTIHDCGGPRRFCIPSVHTGGRIGEQMGEGQGRVAKSGAGSRPPTSPVARAWPARGEDSVRAGSEVRRPGLTDHSRLQLDSGLGASERGPPEPAPSTKPSGLK